jgi:hypothetical protein
MILRDGALYDPDLDRFFRDLPLNGVRSRHSLRAYGYDVLVWVRFLSEACGKSVWQGDRRDVLAYHRVRRRTEAGQRISAASWIELLPVSIGSIVGAFTKACSLKHRSRTARLGGKDTAAGVRRLQPAMTPMSRLHVEQMSALSRSMTTGYFGTSASEGLCLMAERGRERVIAAFAMRCFPTSL